MCFSSRLPSKPPAAPMATMRVQMKCAGDRSHPPSLLPGSDRIGDLRRVTEQMLICVHFSTGVRGLSVAAASRASRADLSRSRFS